MWWFNQWFFAAGTFAIICMMAGKSVSEFSNSYSAIEVATAVTAVVGIWQVSDTHDMVRKLK